MDNDRFRSITAARSRRSTFATHAAPRPDRRDIRCTLCGQLSDGWPMREKAVFNFAPLDYGELIECDLAPVELVAEDAAAIVLVNANSLGMR